MDGSRVRSVVQLGGAVRQARLDRGLTQAQLAAMAGVSRRWLVMLEQGVTRGAEYTKISKTLAVLGKELMVVDAPVSHLPQTLPDWVAGDVVGGN